MLDVYYLFFLFPCLLFIIAVVIKTKVMGKFFKTETFGELIRINVVSNSLSTLVAVPIAVFIPTILQFIAVLLFNSFEVLILVPFFFSSIFFIAYFISIRIEQWAVTKFLGKKYNQETILQAVKSANKASYIIASITSVLSFSMYNAYQASQSRKFLQNWLKEDTSNLETEKEEVE